MNTRGLAALYAKAPLTSFDFERREVGPHDVALQISYAGICHSDIHQVNEEWGSAIFPMVPGHEIAGIVTSVGTSVTKFKIGDRIGVGVFIDSCRTCDKCLAGLQQYCDEGMTGTYNTYERDGKTIAKGGYSKDFVINEDYAVHIPDNLELSGVAPLLCAGITLFSPLRTWKIVAGSKVGIIGLGGLGHMGLKFATAMGAEVTVFSHSENKREDAMRMGAKHFVNTANDGWFKGIEESFDLILNTVSVNLDINQYINLLGLDSTLVVIGLPDQPYQLSAANLLSKRRRISGSMIGGIPEIQEMLDFCSVHNIVSDVEIIDATYVGTAYQRTVASDVKYRFVIDASTI